MRKKRYRVDGPQPVDGHEPGSEYTAAYPAARERRLVDGGFLTLVHHESGHKPHDSADDGAADNDGGATADDSQED